MMPDNKESSDTADQTASNTSPEASHDASTNQTDNAESIIDISPDGDVLNVETQAGDNDDPLDFGDQHAGEADPEALDDVAGLTAQLAAAQAKADEHWDRLLRLQADMENQRKRAQNDVTKARKFALESIVSDLLPVRDSLEMGLSAAATDDVDPKSLIEGAELTLKMLSQVFEKNNILELNPVDEKFDPEFHQAMSMQEVEGKAPNTVTGVMQKGYTLNDRLVRPALVMVSK